MKNYEELSLNSSTFEVIRNDFDLLLQKLFRKMEQSQTNEGSIDLKISIEMQTEFVPQDDGSTKSIDKPVLKHKISTVVPVKDSTDGTKDTGMKLVYDDELKRYVLKYVSTNGQMSIFDMDGVTDEEDVEVVETVPAIEQKTGYFLPDNSMAEEDVEVVDEYEKNAPMGDDKSTEETPFSDGDDEYEDGGFSDYEYDEPVEE